MWKSKLAKSLLPKGKLLGPISKTVETLEIPLYRWSSPVVPRFAGRALFSPVEILLDRTVTIGETITAVETDKFILHNVIPITHTFTSESEQYTIKFDYITVKEHEKL